MCPGAKDGLIFTTGKEPGPEVIVSYDKKSMSGV